MTIKPLLITAALVLLLAGCGKPTTETAGPTETPAATAAGAAANPALEAAVDLHDAGKLAEAVTAYTAILDADPSSLDARVNRGLAYLEQEDYAAAKADFTAAIQQAPEDAELYRLRGDAATATGDYSAAVDDYKASLERDPAQPLVHIHRGLLWESAGEAEAALADYTLAIGLYPDDPAPYELRRDLLKSLELDGIADAVAAEESLITQTQALAATPGDLDLRMQRAEDFYAYGELDACAYDLETILEANAKHARALLYRGHLRMATGNQDAALTDYEAVIALAASAPAEAADAYLGRSFIYDTLGAAKQSRDDRLAAVKLAPESAEAHRLLAWLLATTNDPSLRDPATAVTHARRAVALGPDEPWLAGDTLAAALAAAGEFAEAKTVLAAAIAEAPEEAQEPLSERLALYEQSTTYVQQP